MAADSKYSPCSKCPLCSGCMAICSSTAVLYTKAAPLPMATSVSILGAPCIRLCQPLMKNFWFTTITATANSSCTSPSATGACASAAGRGQPHMP